jgi:hypothetical protein
MPIGEKTITKAFPEPKDHPGKKRDDKAKKMKFPGFWKDPSKQIEQHQQAVKSKKEIVEKFEKNDFHFQKCLKQ